MIFFVEIDSADVALYYGKTQQEMVTKHKNLMPDLIDTGKLGALYERGGTIHKDEPVAVELYKIAAADGSAWALYRLAILSEKHHGAVEADTMEMMETAAGIGVTWAQWWLARHKYFGINMDTDLKEARIWLSRLSLSGDCPPRAMYLLGKECMTESDYTNALAAFSKALDLSGKDVFGKTVKSGPCCTDENEFSGRLHDGDVREIQYIFGECLYYGRGVERDYCKAVKHLLRSVMEDQYLYPNKDAEYLLGECYYYHRGVRKDINQAMIWFRDAAERGSREAREFIERHS